MIKDYKNTYKRPYVSRRLAIFAGAAYALSYAILCIADYYYI
jgi:hypothetical protein